MMMVDDCEGEGVKNDRKSDDVINERPIMIRFANVLIRQNWESSLYEFSLSVFKKLCVYTWVEV